MCAAVSGARMASCDSIRLDGRGDGSHLASQARAKPQAQSRVWVSASVGGAKPQAQSRAWVSASVVPSVGVRECGCRAKPQAQSRAWVSASVGVREGCPVSSSVSFTSARQRAERSHSTRYAGTPGSSR
jgi:hypothetical protein